jgi:8-oxo-dGTP diphosphatase
MDNLMLAGCAIVKDNALLLLHRAKRDQWELPGGKIDSDETPHQAAQRELKEEIGCEVTITKHLGTRDFVEDGNRMTYTWFLGELGDALPFIGEPEKFDSMEFIPMHLLPHLRLSPNMVNFLDELGNQRIVLK